MSESILPFSKTKRCLCNSLNVDQPKQQHHGKVSRSRFSHPSTNHTLCVIQHLFYATQDTISPEIVQLLVSLETGYFLLLSLRPFFRLYRLFIIYGPILLFNQRICCPKKKMNIKIDNIINISAVILTLPFFFASLATLVKRRRMQFFFTLSAHFVCQLFHLPPH